MKDTSPKTRRLVRILGIPAVALCLCLLIWAAVTSAVENRRFQGVLPTAGPLCEDAFAVKAQPTEILSGDAPIQPTTATTRPQLLAPPLSLIKVEYEDGEWKRARLLEHEADFVRRVNSLVCVRQYRTGGAYTDGAGAYRIKWDVRLLTWPDGTVIAKNTFSGSAPSSSKVGSGDRYGGKPSHAALERWLRAFLEEGSVPANGP